MNQYDHAMLTLAAEFSSRAQDNRTHRLGAAAERKDGTIVRARNSPAPYPMPQAHAEYRLSQKIDVGAKVWVVRVKPGGRWGMARPCSACMTLLKRKGVVRICYSILDLEHGILSL